MDTPARINDLTDRIGETVDDLRESAAASLSDDRVGTREIGRVSRRLARLEDTLSGLLVGIGDRLAAVETDVDGLVHRLDRGKRTTWPRRFFWLLVGGAAGVAAAGLMDPQEGAARRNRIKDQALSGLSDVADDVRAKVDYQAGVAKGAIIETAKDQLNLDTAPADLETLRQKIKSEVLGPIEGAKDVDLDVAPGGRVTLTGTVQDKAIEKQLIAAVSDIAGVNYVEDRIDVT